MPLCIPTEHIALSFGERLGGGCHSWDNRDAGLIPALRNAVAQQAIPFLRGLETPADVINRIRTLKLPPDAYYVHQNIGFLQARYGTVSEAIESLDRTIVSLERGLQTDGRKHTGTEPFCFRTS